MKKYNYIGTQSYHATVDGKDIFFVRNKHLELPSENIYIRSMVEMGLLTEVFQPIKSNKRTKKYDS